MLDGHLRVADPCKPAAAHAGIGARHDPREPDRLRDSLLWNHQWAIVALLVAALVVVLPLLRFALLSVVLTLVRVGVRTAWLGRAFRWAVHLDPWAMPDVFLLGCAIGYSRIRANLPVTIEAGGVCVILAALLCMLTRASLDKRTVWRMIAPESRPSEASPRVISCSACELVQPRETHGRPCPRCGLRLSGRRPYAVMRTLALVIAGSALYFPANLFPMSADVQAGEHVTHRIVDGVRELFDAGLCIESADSLLRTRSRCTGA